jgi:hypothetical protein
MRSDVLQRMAAWFDARGSLRGPCLFRVIAGPLVIAHLWPFCAQAVHGEYYRDSFYVPWFAWYPELPRSAYGALLGLGIVAALAMSVGWHARLATRVTCAVVTYNFFLSQTFFHHNRALLVIYLAMLSLIDSAESLSIDAWLHERDPAPRALWPVWLWRTEACVPYLASSTSKLLDPDWFAGVVTWDRVERYRHIAAAYLPHAVLDVVASAGFHAVFAKLVIALELSIGIGLWIPKLRYLAIWLGLVFHVLIQLSADIQVFSLLGCAGLLIWITPRTRDRKLWLRLDTREGARMYRWTRALDWLARFEIIPRHLEGPAIELQDRNGERYRDRAAARQVFARLPLTAPVALPLIRWGLARRAARSDDASAR